MKKIYYYNKDTKELRGESVQNREYEGLPLGATFNEPVKSTEKNKAVVFDGKKWVLKYKFKDNIYLRKDKGEHVRGDSIGEWDRDHGCYKLNGNLFTDESKFDETMYSTDSREENYKNKISECDNLIEYNEDEFSWEFIDDSCEKLNDVYSKLKSLQSLSRVKNDSGSVIVNSGNATDSASYTYSLEDIANAIETIESYNPKTKSEIVDSLIDLILS